MRKKGLSGGGDAHLGGEANLPKDVVSEVLIREHRIQRMGGRLRLWGKRIEFLEKGRKNMFIRVINYRTISSF